LVADADCVTHIRIAKITPNNSPIKPGAAAREFDGETLDAEFSTMTIQGEVLKELSYFSAVVFLGPAMEVRSVDDVSFSQLDLPTPANTRAKPKPAQPPQNNARKFRTAVAIQDSEEFFYVQRKRLTKLVKVLRDTKDISVVHAHRQAGKSTFIAQVGVRGFS
jgi:hypothetical protein